MTNKKSAQATVLLCSLLICRGVVSAEEDFFSLPLQQLMQVEIYTASQQAEKASESPSIVSVISAEQLNDWGITRIHDVLSFLPGVVKSETYLGQTTQTFRGVTPGLFNNKSLYLINGHPAYESLFGSTLVDYIPIEMIERIEVVRGPASVLYASHAISAVINIITRQSRDSQQGITLRAGSFNHAYGSFTHMSQGLSVAASIQRDEGYDYGGTDDEWTNPVNFEYQNDIENIFLDSYGNDWRVNLGYFNQAKAKFGINPWVWQQGIFESYSAYLDANKTFSFATAQLNLWLRYDISNKDIGAGEYPYPQNCSAFVLPPGPCAATNPTNRDTFSTAVNRVERYSFEAQYKDTWGEDINYIIGGSFHSEKLDPLLFYYDSDGALNPNGTAIANNQESSAASLYGQIKYRPDDDFIFIAGLRGENEDDAGSSALLPMLGLSYQMIADLYVKVQYSEAYRRPVFFEKYAQLAGVVFANPELKHETIKSLEVALHTSLDKYNTLQLSAFTLKLEDEILMVAQPAPSTATDYINGEGKESHGLEVEWKSIIDKRIELIINAAFVEGKDNSLGEDHIPFIASKTANLMASYTFDTNWKANWTTQYVGEKDYVITRLQTPATLERGRISSYALSNINLRYHYGAHEMKLIWNNIFDKEYTYPEPVRANIPEVPGGAPSHVYLQYRYEF